MQLEDALFHVEQYADALERMIDSLEDAKAVPYSLGFMHRRLLEHLEETREILDDVLQEDDEEQRAAEAPAQVTNGAAQSQAA